jgi:hypothetical protein
MLRPMSLERPIILNRFKAWIFDNPIGSWVFGLALPTLIFEFNAGIYKWARQ